MPISSDDDDDSKPELNWQLSNRPWRKSPFSINHRQMYETMYYEIPNRPMVDSTGSMDWDITEDYMRERDAEMLRYEDQRACLEVMLMQLQLP